MIPRALLRASDLSRAATLTLFAEARTLKAERLRGVLRDTLRGKHVALYLEKPSVRTRVSFVVGTRELGGDVVELTGAQTKVGSGEHPEDFAAVLARYCHALVARVFSDAALREMAAGAAPMPVINALSDEHHPCQALADLFTLEERFGSVEGLVIAYVGDARNNVTHSLIELATTLGASVRVACPEGYGPCAGLEGAATVRDPREAVAGADAIYTDTWVSMGREDESAVRRRALAGYRVDEALLAVASPRAVVMHCLPAVRDEEIATSVLRGPRSVVLDQAENRLHTQKALLQTMLLAPVATVPLAEATR